MRAPEGVEVEGLLRASTARGAEPAAKRPVGDEPLEHVGELVGVARVDQQARLASDHCLGYASDPGGDDRKTGGHRLQHGDRETLRSARKDERIGGRKELRDVIALSGKAHSAGQAQSGDLPLESRTLRPVADDQGVERVRRQTAEGSNQRREVLGRLEPPDSEDQGSATVKQLRSRRARHVDRIGDDHRPVRGAGLRRKPGSSLAFGHADRDRRQRPHETVGQAIDDRREPGVRSERPAVRREDPDRDTGKGAGKPTENPGLGAAGVQDVGPLPTQHSRQFDEAGEVAPRVDRTPDIPEREETDTCSLGGLAERPGSMCRDRHVEVAYERRKQRCDVGLRATDLGQRDEQQESGSPGMGA